MYHIELSGSAREKGRKHGESFRPQIQELAQIRRNLILGFLKKMTPEEIEGLAQSQVEALKKYPELYAEFSAIAEASSVSETDLMILNNYTDMRDFWFEGRGDQGCSVLSYRKGDVNLSGQTWDMHASATPYTLHTTRLSRSGGNIERTEVLTLTGCLALAGVNDCGVSVMINNMHCAETKIGLMWPGLVLGMLQRETALMAFAYLKENLPCSGHNYLISDAQEAMNVETTGKRFIVTHHFDKKDGVIFHTNHYLSKLQDVEIMARQSKSTHQRYRQLTEYFEQRRGETLQPAQIVRDVFQGKVVDSVCIPKPMAPHETMTSGGILFDYKTFSGEAFQGNYADGIRRPFSFKLKK